MDQDHTSFQSIESLADYVESVDLRLMEASETLGQFTKLKSDIAELEKAYVEYENALPEIVHYQQTFDYWDSLELDMLAKSEVQRSLGQLKRLFLVIKNILRMSREVLGIPDPERMQEGLNMQLQMMGTIHPDQF